MFSSSSSIHPGGGKPLHYFGGCRGLRAQTPETGVGPPGLCCSTAGLHCRTAGFSVATAKWDTSPTGARPGAAGFEAGAGGSAPKEPGVGPKNSGLIVKPGAPAPGMGSPVPKISAGNASPAGGEASPRRWRVAVSGATVFGAAREAGDVRVTRDTAPVRRQCRRGGPQDAVRHPVWPPSTVRRPRTIRICRRGRRALVWNPELKPYGEGAGGGKVLLPPPAPPPRPGGGKPLHYFGLSPPTTSRTPRHIPLIEQYWGKPLPYFRFAPMGVRTPSQWPVLARIQKFIIAWARTTGVIRRVVA